jgi:beclin 1
MAPALFAHFQWSAMCAASQQSSFKSVQVSELCDDAPAAAPSLPNIKLVPKKDPITELVWMLLENTSRSALIDLPLCSKCWKESLQTQQKAIDSLSEEIEILNGLAVVNDNSLALCVCEELGSLVDSDAVAAVMENRTIDVEVAKLRAEVDALQEAEWQLAAEEDRSLRGLTAAKYNAAVMLDGEAAVLMSTELLLSRQKKLESVLLLAEFFIINTNGPFGTINRLRLGRISNSAQATTTEFPVTVTEVNCACGYLLHLLSYMCYTNKVSFASTVLRPNGDSSTIETVPGGGKKGEVLDFFITEKFFKWKTFGSACVVFVQCTKELVSVLQSSLLARFPAHQESPNGNVTFPPHPIEGDKIGGFSVKSGDTNDESWVKGMKSLLAVLDWCISTTTKLSSN